MKNIHNPANFPLPDMDWQTGPYARFARFNFILPYQFLLLCRLMEVTPERVLMDFMTQLGGEGTGPEEQDTTRAYLVHYFIARGYGQQYYTPEQIRQVFAYLGAISMLFPGDDEQMMEDHVLWRAQYLHYWFHKWFWMPKMRHPPCPLVSGP